MVFAQAPETDAAMQQCLVRPQPFRPTWLAHERVASRIMPPAVAVFTGNVAAVPNEPRLTAEPPAIRPADSRFRLPQRNIAGH
jgi:hypothetical protein